MNIANSPIVCYIVLSCAPVYNPCRTYMSNYWSINTIKSICCRNYAITPIDRIFTGFSWYIVTF